MVIGLFLVVVGVTLAIAPIGAARVANTLRFVPFSRSDDAVRQYRTSGIIMAVAGIVVALLLR